MNFKPTITKELLLNSSFYVLRCNGLFYSASKDKRVLLSMYNKLILTDKKSRQSAENLI